MAVHPRHEKGGSYHIPTTRIAPKRLRLHLLVMAVGEGEVSLPTQREMGLPGYPPCRALELGAGHNINIQAQNGTHGIQTHHS